MSKRAAFAIVLTLSAAAPILGQKPEPESPFNTVEVVLNGSSCRDVPEQVFIVMDTRDRNEFTLDKIGKNLWANDLGVWFSQHFGSVLWKASETVRKRTECRPGQGSERTNVLRFTFFRCAAAQDITFDTAPDTLASRSVREEGPCKDPRPFQGSETLRFVAFELEEVRLQFGPPDRRRGLLVNGIVKSKKKNHFVVTRDWVQFALNRQRNHGDGAQSNVSSNAIDLDLETLAAIKFKSVTIGVR